MTRGSMSTLPSFLTDPDPSIYWSDNFVVLDFETTNIEKGTALNADNRLVLTCWYDGKMHHNWDGELDQQKLVAACNKADFLVAHNAKFELQWLDRCGYDIGSRPVFCTMVGEWVLRANLNDAKLQGLDACLARRGLPQKVSSVSKLIKYGVCPSEIPRPMLLRYCKQDVRLTHWLFKSMLEETIGTRLLPVMYTRCLATPVLADIEKNGLHLDRDRVEQVHEEVKGLYDRKVAEFNELTGGINHKSPPQVATFVYGELGFEEAKDRQGTPIRNKATKQFPDGQPKTDEATLNSLKAKTPEQKRFLELRSELGSLSAALDKNLDMFLGAVREHDGMIFALLNQCTTRTHRLSSSGRRTYYVTFDAEKGCQFQNLPREYKRLFSPRIEGNLIGEADGSQIEFRVAGDLGKDPIIIKEVKENYDVHSYTMEVISAHGPKAITRTEAKPHTFKPLYGGTSGTKAEKAYYQAFAEKYHRLAETQKDWCYEVGATKKLETPWGMVFYWPEAKWDGNYLNVRNKVYNLPIQSLATAEIIPIGLTFCWHRLRQTRIILVNTVHDSIEAEFSPEDRQLFQDTATQALTTDVYEYMHKAYGLKFSVPLGVGMVVGHYWGEPLDGEDEMQVQVDPPFANEV